MKDEEVINLFHDAYKNGATRNGYIKRLEKIKSVCGDAAYAAIFADPDASYRALRDNYANVSSRKNMITAILAAFKHSDHLVKLVGATNVARWKKFHDDMDSFQEAKYKKNMPNLKEVSKYTTFEEMELKYKELKAAGGQHATLQSSQWFVFLSMCLAIPPKRADYGNMLVYIDKDPNKKDSNYLVLRSDINKQTQAPSYFVFNVYKTAGEYNTVDQEVPTQVYKDIKDSLRRHPRKHLFVNRFFKPFETNNAFTKYVIRMFETLFGRATSVTMLRHIYITEKVDMDKMNDEELDEVSHQMMHSKALQRKYKWNKDKVCVMLQDQMKRLCSTGGQRAS